MEAQGAENWYAKRREQAKAQLSRSHNELTAFACLQPLPLWQKAAAGLTAGGLGALVGSPADLSLIRMQSDSTLPVDQRRNYKGVGDALVQIIKKDGLGGLFRGAGPTVVRAMSLNMGMLASNDQVGHKLSRILWPTESLSTAQASVKLACPFFKLQASVSHGWERW